MRADTCPRCGGDLAPHQPGGRYHDYCHACPGFVHRAQCVGCDGWYWQLDWARDGDVIPWHSHQCDPKRIAQIEAIRGGVGDRAPRTPTERERLRDGFLLLEAGEEGYPDEDR